MFVECLFGDELLPHSVVPTLVTGLMLPDSQKALMDRLSYGDQFSDLIWT